jgi:cysteine-rich repeat protein
MNFIFSSNNNNCGNLYGVAEIGGRSAWIFWWNYSQSDYSAIVTHEFGHNLGARHAKSYACVDEGGEPVQISDDCVQSEYGDPFDIMGRTIDFRHMNNYHKSQINWFRDINTFDVDSNGEIYEMVPIELESTSVQSLRIPLGYTNLPTNYPVYYYLEYRKSFGFDDFNQEDPVVNGASIRFASEYSPPNPGHSFLIDTTPESSSDDFLDSALIRNNLFEDAFRGIKIETKGATDNLVRVNISFYQPECVHLNPRIRVDPPVQWGSPGDTLNYTVELINFDNHGCNSSDFLINWSYIDFGGTEIPEGWISLPEFPLTITLAPGEAQNIDVAITSADDAEFDFYEFLISMVNLDAPTYEHYWDFNYNVMLLTCGNEVIDPGEFCDGDSISCTAPLGYPGVRECNSICTEYGFCQSDLYCGDGEINGLEECDDGNNNNGDGCSWPECQEEFECGNGVCEIGETNETCPQDCGEAFGFLPSESYHLDADVRYDFADGRNETNIRNKVTGVVWDGRVIGDTLFIGSMVLDFVDMGWSSLYEWVLLGVNQSGSFNTIYDSGGFKVLLSEEDAFPSPTYNFQILGETNIGTEVIVEEFIFGWDFGDLELLGDTVYQDVNHSFNFSIVDNSYVRMNVDIEDGTANIPVLYGDGNQFLGMGRSASKQLAVSSNSTLLYIESEDFVDVHDAFVASWFGG